MDASIIIVSYNTARLIIDCLESLKQVPDAKEIFVVDNASIDKSIEIIATRFPEVKLIANSKNLGFGPANNQALRQCHGRYVIYLNPDATVKPNTIQKAISYMEANQQVGLAGARILNPDGTLQESVSYRYPGEKFTSGEVAGLKGKIACVLGAFMIARKSLLDDLHGFDEDFFLYGEDQDLAWRIRQRGYSVGYIEDAEVFHWGGQSEISTDVPALFEKKLKAEYLFYTKHYKPQTVVRIKRAQIRKARYRLLTLKLTALFARDKLVNLNKTKCYRIALKMARQ